VGPHVPRRPVGLWAYPDPQRPSRALDGRHLQGQTEDTTGTTVGSRRSRQVRPAHPGVRKHPGEGRKLGDAPANAGG
jgi:hypothetical protein